MKILNAQQIKELDAFTIRHEPIASIDLMERASGQFADWFIQKFPNNTPVLIFCGVGNNGGDGLAVARMLCQAQFNVEVMVVRFSEKTSEDFQVNEQRLNKLITIQNIHSEEDIPLIEEGVVIIDAIFGSGLSRPIDGFTAQLVRQINHSQATVISIDTPSGLYCSSNNSDTHIIEADYTVSFQLPKLSFLLPQNQRFTGTWELVEIGLDPEFIEQCETSYHFITSEDASHLLKKRKKFSHKGHYGHALLLAGSFGKMGAALLSAKATLRTGVGLLTCHLPLCGYSIMQTALPEAMCSIDHHEHYITEVPSLAKINAIGIGPGLNQHVSTIHVLEKLIQEAKQPLVFDADALNILAEHKYLLKQVPENSILTPHPKEFERLAGETINDYDRLKLLQEFVIECNVIVVLKGAHTAIALPNGSIYFNSTGNPGMATAGSGDVLTGIILSLLAQNYTPDHAAILGVYLHGLAGDLARETEGEEALIASDIVEYLGEAFAVLRNVQNEE
ncbi:NAD(P)H-hydrate dehydratase [Rapidithrix thailandica]|uniref:Bifunctional NAD(P)H-hydrate repair enzyme n=1 Tax=Rapidithrix thailandica TaxID=413964 RepID=A0AAW9RP30_9BACT